MDSTDAPRTLAGGCWCGAVRFEIARVFDVRYCHCADCRRSTGAPCTVTAVVRREDFRVLSGELVAERRPHGTEHACARCHRAVYYEFEASVGTLESVPVGFLDDPDACTPRVHQFFARRLRWFHVHDTLPKYGDHRLPHPETRG